MIQESLALFAMYAGPKLISTLAAKFGVIPVANFFSAIAPSMMSYTFFACTAHHLPKFAGLALLPQLGLSALVFMSMGPNSFTLKNIIFPSVAAIVGYQGWLTNLSGSFLSAAFMFDHVAMIKQTSMIAAIALIILHILYVSRAFAVRIVYPAPIISQMYNLKQLRENALSLGAIRQRIPSSQTPGAFLDALFFTTPNTQVRTSSYVSDDRFPHAWLIYLGGNGEVAEASFDSARELGNSLGCKVAVFNPRGVGDSGGLSQ